MGCFSFLCKVSGKPALSNSLNGSRCYLFLLKDGKVIEEMYGNYDSYGRVFKRISDESGNESIKWKMEWEDVCDLIYSENVRNGIALILEENYDGTPPTTRSEEDPDQGWGRDWEYFADGSKDHWQIVVNPYHKVYSDNEDESSITIKNNEEIVLTKLELKTIMEDAFIDGWKQGQDSDWFDPEDFLADHHDPVVLEETHCETAIAIKNLMEE